MMSFEEKVTWVSAVVTVVVAGAYAWVVGGRLGRTPAAEVPYVGPLLVAVGAMIVLTIVGAVAVAIGSAIAAEIRGGRASGDLDRRDERDASIDAKGDRVAYYVTSALMIGVLALALLEVDHFWIANAMFMAFVVAGLIGTGVKLVSYRCGY